MWANAFIDSTFIKNKLLFFISSYTHNVTYKFQATFNERLFLYE
jgi:hypothetical protein